MDTKNYRIHFTPSGQSKQSQAQHNTKGIGGAAIEIRTNLLHTIKDIKWINNRIMRLQRKTHLQGIKINMPTTYAPHTGYAIDERTEYWNNIKNILTEQKRSTHCLICATGNNGQIATQTSENAAKYIGPSKYSNLTEKEMDQISPNIAKMRIMRYGYVLLTWKQNKAHLSTCGNRKRYQKTTWLHHDKQETT